MQDERLRVGVVGGGFITQVMHLPSLMELTDRFEVVGLADPSRTTRETLASRYGMGATFAGYQELLENASPDALLVLSPGSTHAKVIMAALDAGVHVFTEKPLCLVAEDAWEIARASERTGRLVQIGYMKRYDPAYEQMLTALAERRSGDIRLIDCVTYDPGLERFFAPAAMTRGDDIPPAFMAHAREREAEQVQRAVGATTAAEVRVYVQVLCDTLVHDVNVLGGILSALQEPQPRVIDTAWWAEGRSMQTTLELSDGARCVLSLLDLPGLQDFHEEMRIHFDDAVHRLRFPAPYLRHCPTLYERTSERDGRSHTERWESWAESFVTELVHFHDCVRLGHACRTPPHQAARDLELLAQIFKARTPSHAQPPAVE
jgi:predicted dehydrogenase